MHDKHLTKVTLLKLLQMSGIDSLKKSSRVKTSFFDMEIVEFNQFFTSSVNATALQSTVPERMKALRCLSI